MYGAKTPDTEDQIVEILKAANVYRNRLCEIELDRRSKYYATLAAMSPEYAAIAKKIEDLETRQQQARNLLKAMRAKHRTLRPDGADEIVSEILNINKLLRAANKEEKAAQKVALQLPVVVEALAIQDQENKVILKQAKDTCGFYWGTEAIIRESCKAFRKGSPPKFKRFTGEGQVGLQIAKGLPTSNLQAKRTLLQLHIPQELQRKFANGEKVRDSEQKAECWFRIDSENRKPVFAKVPIIFSRPFPDGAVIKQAFIERRKIANMTRWKVRFSIEVPYTNPPQPNDQKLPSHVAIHVGWRFSSSGLRVATWLGSDGRYGTLVLPKSHCDDYMKLDSVQADRDEQFNAMRKRLSEWKVASDIPEWLSAETESLHAWKSQQRLASLCLKWASQRFEGDESIFNELDAWRKKDKARWQHSRRLSSRVARRRKDLFHVFAKQMRQAYDVAIVAAIGVKELTSNSEPEDMTADISTQHRHANWASVSQLSLIIQDKFFLRSVPVSSVNITRRCAACGNLNDVNRRSVQCHSCGTTYDVDTNAATNMLSAGEQALWDGALDKLVESQENKVAARKDKQRRMAEARRRATEKRKKAEEEQKKKKDGDA